jgi:Protein of unknown function (DUF2934)
MPEPTEAEIKARAYKIWERRGCPKDKEDECWQAAVQELKNEDKTAALRTPDSLR